MTNQTILERQNVSEATKHTNETAVHTARRESSPLLGLLNTLLSSKMDYQQKAQILQNDYEIPMVQDLTEEVTHMAHILHEIGLQYAEKAYAEGTAYGRTEGIAQGTQTTLTNSIRNLMTALHFSTKQAMDVLQVPEAERPLYEDLLQKQAQELRSEEPNVMK
ncbi:MAG: hypothetical protein IJV50_07105 [Lachnospiraceae bacterium]|nr:hypothetical protein [Lachnospiraceae bacterium]